MNKNKNKEQSLVGRFVMHGAIGYPESSGKIVRETPMQWVVQRSDGTEFKLYKDTMEPVGKRYHERYTLVSEEIVQERRDLYDQTEKLRNQVYVAFRELRDATTGAFSKVGWERHAEASRFYDRIGRDTVQTLIDTMERTTTEVTQFLREIDKK